MAGQSRIVQIGHWRGRGTISTPYGVSEFPVLPQVSASITAEVKFSLLIHVPVSPTSMLDHMFELGSERVFHLGYGLKKPGRAVF